MKKKSIRHDNSSFFLATRRTKKTCTSDGITYTNLIKIPEMNAEFFLFFWAANDELFVIIFGGAKFANQKDEYLQLGITIDRFGLGFLITVPKPKTFIYI